MNIAILPTAYPNIYNDHSSIFVQDQAEALINNGVNIIVIGAIPISFKDIWNLKFFKLGYYKSSKNGVEIKLFLFPSIPKLKYFNNFIRDTLNKILLKNHCQKNKINLVHVHNVTAGGAALWVKSKFNIPYCITEHSSAYARNLVNKKDIERYRKIYKGSSSNIVVSNIFSKLLENIFNLQFKYIPNVVNTNYFKNSTTQSEKNNFKFVNIANLNKNKNQILLLQAFKKAFHNNKNIKLDIFGSELENLNREIKRLKLGKQVLLHGFAKREVVRQALQNSDAFVLSSEYETFGVVLIEAMSCGLPVLSTKCGGPESIIIRDELAIMLPKKDEDAVNIVALSIMIAFFVSFILFLIVFIFNTQITNLLGNPEISSWFYFIPVTVLLTGIYQSFNYWSNRKKHYKRLATSRVVQSGTTATSNLGMGFGGLGSGGLILSTVLGQSIATLVLGSRIFKNDFEFFKQSVRRLKIFALIKKYIKMPMLNLPNTVIDGFRLSGITILIAKYFTVASLGQFSLAWKMLQMPMSLIGSSISQVFFQKIASSKKSELYYLVKQFIIKASIFILPVFIVIYFYSVDIFSFVFGRDWVLAGEIASTLSPWIFINFISSPVAHTFIILNKQEIVLYASII